MNPLFRGLALTLLLASAGCVSVRHAVRGVLDGDWRMAQQVVIQRDDWGVPHIEGESDAAAVFGLGYAQAEDNFWQLEEDYIHVLGRAAQLYGERFLASDIVRAAFEVERLSREEYAREPRERRALWDAYAAGINYWIRNHPETPPRLLHRFEPWFAFARFRSVSAATTIDDVALRDVIAEPIGVRELIAPAQPAGEAAAGEPDSARVVRGGEDLERITNRNPLEGEPGWPIESNAWAIAPGRTADGRALLFQNPHVSFFGSGQRWEVHLRSASGWHVAGFAILGTPMIRSGHNEHLGWTHTNTAADAQDAFRVRFDHPSDPLLYRWGTGWRPATVHEADVLVRTEAGLERQRYRFLRTHHGPVVALPDGGRAAVRIARFEDGGSLQQWNAMGRAGSFDEFRTALAAAALPISNTMYADRDGNIFYLHGNAVPRRDTRFDWTRPVDGADSTADWQGYHSIDELPQLLNPPAGWIQNTNATPFLATAESDNLARDRYPSYMAREPDNARARVSREILRNARGWTLDTLARAAFDTRVLNADGDIPRIIDEWERLGAEDGTRALAVQPAIDALRDWDRRSTIDSPAMTLYVLWNEAVVASVDTAADHANSTDRSADAPRRWPLIEALESAVRNLQSAWNGELLVPWGEVNRLQRIHTSGTGPFDPAQPSLPVAGAPGGLGIVFAFGTRPGPKERLRFGVRGHTWVGIAAFGATVEARSIVTFGQSADPASPHWFDQAPLYARGDFKPAYFQPDEIAANVRRSYHPGERPGTALDDH